jgi:hypothetical protein
MGSSLTSMARRLRNARDTASRHPKDEGSIYLLRCADTLTVAPLVGGLSLVRPRDVGQDLF